MGARAVAPRERGLQPRGAFSCSYRNLVAKTAVDAVSKRAAQLSAARAGPSPGVADLQLASGAWSKGGGPVWRPLGPTPPLDPDFTVVSGVACVGGKPAIMTVPRLTAAAAAKPATAGAAAATAAPSAAAAAAAPPPAPAVKPAPPASANAPAKHATVVSAGAPRGGSGGGAPPLQQGVVVLAPRTEVVHR